MSGKYVADAKAIAKKNPELAEKVRDGTVTLQQAKRQLAPKVTDFDTKALDEQPARKQPKPGKPLVSNKQRKDCLRLYARFCRSLAAVGVYDEFIGPLSEIGKRLKQI